jgi:hypothetical protein
VSETVFRPRLAAAGRQFAVLASVYLVLGALLCWSLSTWALSLSAAAVLFAGFVLLMAACFTHTFRRTSIVVDEATVAYHNAWNRPTRVLNRSEVVRVMSIDRIQGSLPIGVLLIVDRDGRRIGAGQWLWGADILAGLVAALADDRVRPEHRASASSVDILREFGVDPAIKRRPIPTAAMMLASAAAGVVLAWPVVRALL